jgi:hypothetical protein
MVLKDMLIIFNPCLSAGRSASLRLCGKSLYRSSTLKNDSAKISIENAENPLPEYRRGIFSKSQKT